MSDATRANPEEFEDPLSDYEPKEYKNELDRALAEEPITAIRSRPYAEIHQATPVRQAIHALQGLKISSLILDGQPSPPISKKSRTGKVRSHR